MALRIEHYAFIGDTQTGALVGTDGSIDWACFPRLDAAACFAALLGGPDDGRWSLAPRAPVRRVRRRYVDASLVLETEMETDDGVVRLVDFMPPRGEAPDVVRLVVGVRGRVAMRTKLVVRFDYGRRVPWVRTIDGVVCAVAGPDELRLATPVATRGEGLATVADFVVEPGARVPFVLTWHPSHQRAPVPVDAEQALADTLAYWRVWSARCTYDGPWRDAVATSLCALKGLTYAPTGGVLAAATTSLPEHIGGVRNWDYRYCWLRDATLTLYALMQSGHVEEAIAWREWLLRAAAGDVAQLQIMYGVAGEQRLPETELPWLSGYEGSRPVRVGNAAVSQVQLDVYGEVVDALYQARRLGIPPHPWAWRLVRRMLDELATRWRAPDEGIWEVRGPPRRFTHSRVMAWVAFDRALKSVEELGVDGDVDRWRALRDEIHRDVCDHGFDASRGAFTQSYGRPELDASLLLLPLVGFLPPDEPRVVATVRAIERELVRDGLVLRYLPDPHGSVDGLPGDEGAFLACSFWLVDAYVAMDRRDDAERLFERLLSVRNDVGLLAEEYDPTARRQLGNFPQAFSHLALVTSALNLARAPDCPAEHRPARRP